MDPRSGVGHHESVSSQGSSFPLARIPAPVARARADGDRWRLVDASDRFRSLAGAGDDLFDTRIRVERNAFESAARAALESDAEQLLEAELDTDLGMRPYRLALRSEGADGELLLLSLCPKPAVGMTTDAHFETIVQESPDIIAMIDRELRHRFVNRAVEAASGLSTADFEGKSHDELGMPDEVVRYFQSVYREVFATGREGRKVFEFPSADGTLRTYESRVVPLVEPDGSIEVLLSYARDTTERKANEAARLELERKMQETQRLESLGVLAGGIAHDFNNLLTSILGIASLTRAQLRDMPAVAGNLDQIEMACMKAADLCGQMLAYAGRGRAIKQSLQLAGLIRETRELLGASVSKDIRFELDLPAEVSAVEVDRSQMQQVLMNLLLNGAEAMSGQGMVSVALREIDGAAIPWEAAVLEPSERHGAMVEVTVTDRGVGMDETTMARIFDPFFTTKFTGRGLGLAATLGIVRQHGGGLAVESEPGRGTTFRLYLPSSNRANAAAAAAAPSRTELPPCRVLLVDDEVDVRDATGRMLEALGHEVALASEGVEALARFDAAQSGFDVVLLDLTMPGMDGIATLEQFRERAPELPVVLMSGYTEEDVRARMGDERTTFLPKPFHLEWLAEALRRAVPAGGG